LYNLKLTGKEKGRGRGREQGEGIGEGRGKGVERGRMDSGTAKLIYVHIKEFNVFNDHIKGH